MTVNDFQALRILFITLEFRSGTFSGNGVYAKSQVRALAAAGHKVFVVAGRPGHVLASEETLGTHHIAEVPVSSWHRLDAGAPWREFAAGASEDSIAEAVRAFRPHLVFGVDWSALPAVRQLAPCCGGAPYVYLNYRVFTRTATGDDLELVRGLEAEAMAEAVLTVALSRSDAAYLADHVAGAGGAARAAKASSKGPTGSRALRQAEPGEDVVVDGVCVVEPEAEALPLGKGTWCGNVVPKVLLPALREDVRQLPPPTELLHLAGRGPEGDRVSQSGACQAALAGAAAAVAARPYLSCVVRLSPEKEPERFVAVVEALADQGLLQRHGLTPLLLGAANDEYAQGIKARLRAACPEAVVLEAFVGPSELADLYRRTRLNFHPSTYDAYGMTIVEAASQGAASIVHDGDGAVGATDLLRASHSEVLLLDLTSPAAQVAEAIGRLLEDPRRLAEVSAAAMQRARSWDEAANAAELVHMALVAAKTAGATPGQCVAEGVVDP